MSTIPEIISRTRTELNATISEVNSLATDLDTFRQQDAPDPTRVASTRSKRAAAEARIEDLRSKLEMLQRESDDDDRMTRDAQVSNETESGRLYRAASQRDDSAFYTSSRSSTYHERNQGEFLRDLYEYSTGSLHPDASQRLLKHEQEARATGRMTERAASTTTFAGIIPPQYLIDQYALVARAGRPTANTVQHLDLPPNGMSFIIPKGTTGVSTAVQTAENAALSTTDEVWSNITVPVFAVGAYNDVSRQSLDRAEGVDQIIFNDLAASYSVSLNQQVLSGTGSSGQGLGILNTSGISQATAYSAAVTMATFYSKIAGQINAIQSARYMAPDVIILNQRRWNWLLTQLDTTGRPLVSPEANGPMNAYAISTIPLDTGSANAVGSIMGIPVVTDASIPTNVGSASEDVAIVMRKEDVLLWEDPGAPFTLRFDQTVGTNLTVRLVAYGYAAVTAARFPTAVGIVGGNSASTFGQVAPTF